jgi:hypothetical protein
MIPVTSLGGNQFLKARALALPVVVIDALTFRIPSSGRAGRDHTVLFDSSETPSQCSCTCEAGEHGIACWAMARALDALTVLGVNNIYIAGSKAPPHENVADTLVTEAAARAASGERGDLLLTFSAAEVTAGGGPHLPNTLS